MNTALTIGVGAALFAVILVLYAAVIAVGAAILSWAWNLVVPSTFNGPTLEFFPAFALLVVLVVIKNFLFGGSSKR